MGGQGGFEDVELAEEAGGDGNAQEGEEEEAESGGGDGLALGQAGEIVEFDALFAGAAEMGDDGEGAKLGGGVGEEIEENGGDADFIGGGEGDQDIAGVGDGTVGQDALCRRTRSPSARIRGCGRCSCGG